ncbi:hypothetical protein SLS62_004795 [Diatrype stigma]|uniref:LSM complex subunit LSM4 n=1 Tax=Diatrype stigma TaxID=117547 RepID=A0AAN9YQ92_9PEZI
MLPLGLLNAAQGHPMLVELKNGETLNGHLIQCDTWMNLTLKEVIQTSPEADNRGGSEVGVADTVKDEVTTAEEEAIEEAVGDEAKAEEEAAAEVPEEGMVRRYHASYDFRWSRDAKLHGHYTMQDGFIPL